MAVNLNLFRHVDRRILISLAVMAAILIPLLFIGRISAVNLEVVGCDPSVATLGESITCEVTLSIQNRERIPIQNLQFVVDGPTPVSVSFDPFGNVLSKDPEIKSITLLSGINPGFGYGYGYGEGHRFGYDNQTGYGYDFGFGYGYGYGYGYNFAQNAEFRYEIVITTVPPPLPAITSTARAFGAGAFAGANNAVGSLGSISQAPNPPKKSGGKISNDLVDLASEYQEYQLQGDGEGFNAGNPIMPVNNGRVVIDAIASGDAGALKADLEDLGLRQAAAFGGMVSGNFPISAISDMAELDTLIFARPAYRISNAGLVTSQGDAAMHSDDVRSTFGLDGSGVTVGTLSVSYDCLGGAAGDVASGDLPAGITVLEEEDDCTVGNDEGRAIMQLIHDVAPGANQLFHSAFNGLANFAQGIIDLNDAGANVIVDDVIYLFEPMFQDGIIAQAVDTVKANGVAYFSSAGNGGRRAYQSAFNPSGIIVHIGGFFNVEGHDFGSGDIFQNITIPSGSTLIAAFQWDDPSASVCPGCPGADTDMDIILFADDETTLVALSAFGNIDGNPSEVLLFKNTGATADFNILLGKFSGPNPGLMKYVLLGSSLITINEFDTLSGTVYGHANAAGAEAVGAADYLDTPEFGTSPPLLESFSSAGPTPILFDILGNPIAAVERQKPEIVAPDGTNTTFFGSPDTDFPPRRLPELLRHLRGSAPCRGRGGPVAGWCAVPSPFGCLFCPGDDGHRHGGRRL